MKINFSGRGGAADGLAYFGVLKEMINKNITAGKIALTSVSTVVFSLWAMGYDLEKIVSVIKGMKFDRIMKAERAAELGEVDGKKIKFGRRAAAGLITLIAAKTFFFRSMERHFKKYYKWENIKLAEKVYIGFTTREELGKYSGKKTRFGLFTDLVRMMSKTGSRQKYQWAYKNMSMFWASNDGVYTVDTNTNKFLKISSDVIPLHLAVLAAFKNPLFKKFKIKFNGKNHRPFDLGILNNESNLAFIEESVNSFHQISCDDAPKIAFQQGKTSLSDYFYNKHRPKKVHIVKPIRKKAFLNFNDAEVEFEYKNQKMTDFF